MFKLLSFAVCWHIYILCEQKSAERSTCFSQLSSISRRKWCPFAGHGSLTDHKEIALRCSTWSRITSVKRSFLVSREHCCANHGLRKHPLCIESTTSNKPDHPTPPHPTLPRSVVYVHRNHQPQKQRHSWILFPSFLVEGWLPHANETIYVIHTQFIWRVLWHITWKLSFDCAQQS